MYLEFFKKKHVIDNNDFFFSVGNVGDLINQSEDIEKFL